MSQQVKVNLKGISLSHNAASQRIARSEFDSISLRVSTFSGKEFQMVDFKKGTKVVASLGISALSYALLKDEEGDSTPIGAALGIGREKTQAYALPTTGGFISSDEKDPTTVIAAMKAKDEDPGLTKQQRTFLKGLEGKTQKLFQPVIEGWKASEFKLVTA